MALLRRVNREYPFDLISIAIIYNGVAHADSPSSFNAAGIDCALLSTCAYRNTHYRLMSEEKQHENLSFSYRFMTPKGDVLISGNTGMDSRMAAFGKDVSVFISEVASPEVNENVWCISMEKTNQPFPSGFVKQLTRHMKLQHISGQNVGMLASEMGIGAVLLHHFGPFESAGSGLAQNKKDIRTTYSGDVYMTNDLDRFCLDDNKLKMCNDR